MLLPNTRAQIQRDFTYDASGTITTGGTAQLLLPERKSTSMLVFQNISDTVMTIKFGSAKAHATLTNGVVTSVTVDDGGFGFTYPPAVNFLGGGITGWNTNDGGNVGAGLPMYPCPDSSAKAHAVLSGGAVSSIVVDGGGSNYGKAPYVFLHNSLRDPYGVGTASATSGIQLAASGGTYYVNGTACTTDPVSIFCATTGKAFTCYWME